MSAGDRQNGGEGRSDLMDEDDLISALYGELEGEEERAMNARLAFDPALAGHMAGLERVRDLYRGLADEEPPARISAHLLAHAAHTAAGRKAPVSRERAVTGGTWSRFKGWLQPIALHPGLAAAASLLLVAGVAGTLYLRKGDDMTRTADAPPVPEPSATGPAAGIETSAAGEGAGTGQGAAAATEESPGTTTEELDFAEPEGTIGSAEDDRGSVARRREKKRAPAGGGGARAPRENQDEGARAKTDAPREDSRRSGTVLGLAEQEMSPPADADSSAGVSGDRAPAERASPAPSSSTASPSVPGASPQPSSDEASSHSVDAPKAPATPARSLHQQAITAASARRCAEVQSIGDKIRRADPAYHAGVFRRDSRVAACLGAGKPAKK